MMAWNLGGKNGNNTACNGVSGGKGRGLAWRFGGGTRCGLTWNFERGDECTTWFLGGFDYY